DRKETARSSHPDIPCTAQVRTNEGDRPREQTNGENHAANQLNKPTGARERTELDVGETRNSRKTENFRRAVLKQQQPGINAQHAQSARRPSGYGLIPDCSLRVF